MVNQDSEMTRVISVNEQDVISSSTFFVGDRGPRYPFHSFSQDIFRKTREKKAATSKNTMKS